MDRQTFTSGPLILTISVQAFVREHKMMRFCSYSVVPKPVDLNNFV